MRFLSQLLVLATMGFSAAGAVRIMPFGDSITELGCWRAMLWQQLQTAGYTNLDFVGSVRSTTNCNIQYDPDNEGHSGFLATNIADQNQLVPWLSSTNPDIVLMHLGTNDMWNNKSTQQILAAFTKLVGQMRANNPSMKIIVAKIIPMNMSFCTGCSQGIIALNNAIPAWASQLSSSASPIIVVDQYTGFSATSDTGDGVHPNTTGDQKIAKVWYPAVVTMLGTQPTGVTPTSPGPSSVTVTSSTPTPTSSSGQVAAWGQCGGINWKGGTTCVSGYTCKVGNAYYSQCVPS